MKVVLVNGSPHARGSTYTALCEIAKTLEAEGIEAEIFQLGTKPISGCLGCGGCFKTGKCVIDDIVNEFVPIADEADGLIFGSPVHYAAAGGSISCFMDRLFYGGKIKSLRLKPGAAVVCARRGGTTAAFEQLNKYFTISEMPVISSCYWNMVHGTSPEEVQQDEEGMRCMRVLAKNMAWFLKCKEAAKAAGIEFPEPEPPKRTNFIR